MRPPRWMPFSQVIRGQQPLTTILTTTRRNLGEQQRTKSLWLRLSSIGQHEEVALDSWDYHSRSEFLIVNGNEELFSGPFSSHPERTMGVDIRVFP